MQDQDGQNNKILPVIPHESRGTLIENCVTSWHEFPYFRKITLTRNMRALLNEIEFVEFLGKKLVTKKAHNSLSLVKVLSKYLNN